MRVDMLARKAETGWTAGGTARCEPPSLPDPNPLSPSSPCDREGAGSRPGLPSAAVCYVCILYTIRITLLGLTRCSGNMPSHLGRIALWSDVFVLVGEA